MSPFDFINSINTTKENLLDKDPHNKKEYSAYMVNRGMSYFYDTIMHANEMNIHRTIPIEWQYEYYLQSITKKKRFSKWSKKEKAHSDIKLLMKEYNYSESKAEEVINILSEDQLKALREKYTTGGR